MGFLMSERKPPFLNTFFEKNPEGRRPRRALQGEAMKEKIKRLSPVLFLIPAVLVAVLIAFTLPDTVPVLRDIPERLTQVVQAKAVREEKEESPEAEEEEEEIKTDILPYEDGTYTGSARGYGGEIRVSVTMKDGKITDVQILSASGETDSFFTRAKGVIGQVLRRQTWEVDAVSGATYSSRGILGAVKNALTGESVVNEAPATTSPKGSLKKEAFKDGKYADGVYTGTAPGFGGNITVEVTIKNGKIAGIRVLDHSGETASYYKRAAAVTGRILKAGTPNVDTVSGATYSSNGIINAVKRALKKAAGAAEEETEKEPVIDPEKMPEETYRDGEYFGTGEGYGGDIKVRVVIEGGRIGAVEVLEHEGETASFYEKASVLPGRILAAQSAQVDTVSGATFSSEGIISAVKDALSKALVSGGEAEDPKEPGEETDEEGSPYADGVFEGTCSVICPAGEDGEYDFEDYQVLLLVSVEEGKVTDISLSEDTPVDRTNRRYFKKALEPISEAVLEAQEAEGIDSISGATCSSEGILQALREALEKSKEEKKAQEKAGSGLTDGVFDGEARVVCPADEEGEHDFEDYEILLHVTVEEGKVVGIVLSEDTPVDQANRRYWNKAFGPLKEALLESGSLDGLDSVSGATCSSKAILEAVQKALSLPGGKEAEGEEAQGGQSLKDPEGNETPEGEEAAEGAEVPEDPKEKSEEQIMEEESPKEPLPEEMKDPDGEESEEGGEPADEAGAPEGGASESEDAQKETESEKEADAASPAEALPGQEEGPEEGSSVKSPEEEAGPESSKEEEAKV